MNKISQTNVVTLKAVIVAVTASEALSAREWRDMVSAIMRFCALTRTVPEAVLVDVREIDRQFQAISPAAAGVSPRTLKNIRSGVFRAIAVSGLAPVWRNSRVAWSDEWKSLDAALKSDGRPSYQNVVLRRFGTWCSAQGIAPSAVDDDTLARYSADMATCAARHRNTLSRDIARRWGELGASHPDLGLRGLTVPAMAHRNHRAHLDALPASYRQGVEDYASYLRCDDPLADGARSRPLRPASVTSEIQALLTLANAAIANGVDPMTLASPDALLDVAVAKPALQFLLARSGGKTTGGIERIRKSLLAYARHRLQDDPDRLAALKALIQKVRPLRPGMTEKNDKFLLEVSGDEVRARILDVPRRLFRRGMALLATNPKQALADIQTAIAIEVLLLHALRRTNLGALSWSQHIVWNAGAAAPNLISLPREEMKNGEPMTRAIGSDLARMLVTYRGKVIPAAVSGDPDAVFCRRDGRPLSVDALAHRITEAMWEFAGVRMTMHQFRHLSATLILDAHPGSYELARDQLGHSTTAVTSRYYAGLRPLQASRVYGKIIEEARDASRLKTRKPRKPPPGKSRKPPSAEPPRPNSGETAKPKPTKAPPSATSTNPPSEDGS